MRVLSDIAAGSHNAKWRARLLWAAAFVAVLIAGYAALWLPVSGSDYRTVMTVPRSLMVVVGVVVLVRFAPKPYVPLMAVLSAQLAFLGGRLSQTFLPDHMWIAHFCYVSAYLPLIWATYWLSVRWLQERPKTVFFDTAIVTAAVVAVTADWLIIPTYVAALTPGLSSAELLSKVTTVMYLHLATLVAGLGLRLALMRGRSNSRIVWLFAGTCTQFLGELSWQLPLSGGSMRLLADWCYLLSCIGFVFAVGLPERRRREVASATKLLHKSVQRTYREGYVLTFGLVVPALFSALMVLVAPGRVGVATHVASATVAVLVALRLRGVIVASQRKAQGLLQQATHDPLTKCLNRSGWAASVDYASDRSAFLPHAVLIIDLDHFKKFNDRHGHLAGDELLQQVSCSWAAALPADAALARLGGEEFGVILPVPVGQDVEQVATELIVGLPCGVTCSAGVAMLDGEHSSQVVVSAADKALYRAKEAGRARVELAVAADYEVVGQLMALAPRRPAEEVAVVRD